MFEVRCQNSQITEGKFFKCANIKSQTSNSFHYTGNKQTGIADGFKNM